MHFFKLFSLFLVIALIGSCASIKESSNQFITFETPGAQDAKCYVYVNKLRYQVFPPQTINVKKSSEEMRVQCDAPGNRSAEIFVPAMFSKKAIWGGPAGLAWDYGTEALHHYPSVIAVDFSQTEVKPFDLPKHNNKDIKQPEEYDLEEFLPARPRMNADKNKIKNPIVRRGQAVPYEYLDEDTGDDKGNLKPAPAVVSPSGTQEDASDMPVNLYPGQ